MMALSAQFRVGGSARVTRVSSRYGGVDAVLTVEVHCGAPRNCFRDGVAIPATVFAARR